MESSASISIGSSEPGPERRGNGQTTATAALESEWGELLSWLNAGLRADAANREARLQSEFPTALEPPDLELHSVVKVAGRFASHAFARIIEVRAEDCTLSFGMIGLVYTDPVFRGSGLAAACIARCIEKLRQRGVPMVGLWSDLHPFYARLGFEPAGQAFLHSLSHADCERALLESTLLETKEFAIHEPRESDWAALEALYDAKPSRAIRNSGDLQRLAAAPETRVVAAFSGGSVRAYAAMGRGDDFHGVVHEWAGQPHAVIACLAELSRPGPIHWLTGAAREPAVSVVTRSGHMPVASHFALLRILDPGQIWSETQKRRGNTDNVMWQSRGSGFLLQTQDLEMELTHSETLHLLLGPKQLRPARIDAGFADAMRKPWPLFVWGFDSN